MNNYYVRGDQCVLITNSSGQKTIRRHNNVFTSLNECINPADEWNLAQASAAVHDSKIISRYVPVAAQPAVKEFERQLIAEFGLTELVSQPVRPEQFKPFIHIVDGAARIAHARNVQEIWLWRIMSRVCQVDIDEHRIVEILTQAKAEIIREPIYPVENLQRAELKNTGIKRQRPQT